MLYSIVGADDREYGPVDKSVLVQWAREGRVVARTTVIEHESGRRYLACDVPELAAIFSPSGAIAPPRVGRGYPETPPPAPGPLALPGRSPRSRIAAGLLGILLPGLGAHRFYLGYSSIGLIQLLMTFVFSWMTCGATALASVVWCFIEGIVCLTGGMTDAEGRALRD